MRRYLTALLLLGGMSSPSHAIEKLSLQPKGCEIWLGLRPQNAFRLIRLSQLDAPQMGLVKRGVVDLAAELYLSAERRGHESVFPVQEDFFDKIAADQQSKSLSAVIVEGDQIIGFALAQLDLEHNTVHLHKLGVAEKAQGFGLSRHLLRAVAMRAKELGQRTLDLEVRAGNVQAIRAYAHMGFKDITRAEDFDAAAEPSRTLSVELDKLI